MPGSDQSQPVDAIERDAVRAEYLATVGRIGYVLGLGDGVDELATVEEEIERLQDECARHELSRARILTWIVDNIGVEAAIRCKRACDG